MNLVNELNYIFTYYKKKFNLSTRLDLYSEGFNCAYHSVGDYIFFGFRYVDEYIINGDLQERSGLKNKLDLYKWILLHELKHAIDFSENPIEYLNEFSNVNRLLYDFDRSYHHSRPWEIRADNFANEEIKQWL